MLVKESSSIISPVDTNTGNFSIPLRKSAITLSFIRFFFRRAVQAERRCIKDRSFFLTRCTWASGSKPPSLLLKERGRSQPIIIPIIWGFEASNSELSYSFSHESFFHVIMVKTTFVAANSLINPIIYAIRMPEVRTVITKIISAVLQTL